MGSEDTLQPILTFLSTARLVNSTEDIHTQRLSLLV